jgi:hypothetical protein
MNSSLTVGRGIRLLALSLVAVLLMAPTPSAGARSKVTKRKVATPTSVSRIQRPSSGAAGMVVGLDPESGRVGLPTPEQMARIAAAAKGRATASVRPAPVYHSDGSISLDVRTWMRDYAVVRLGANGRAVLDCVDGRDAATRTLREAPAAPTAREER